MVDAVIYRLGMCGTSQGDTGQPDNMLRCVGRLSVMIQAFYQQLAVSDWNRET